MKDVFYDPQFVIYRNSIPELFSRRASMLYVNEKDRETTGKKMPKTPEQLKEEKRKNQENGINQPNIPDARENYIPPNGLNWEQYYSQIREVEMSTVKEIKKKILNALIE